MACVPRRGQCGWLLLPSLLKGQPPFKENTKNTSHVTNAFCAGPSATVDYGGTHCSLTLGAEAGAWLEPRSLGSAWASWQDPSPINKQTKHLLSSGHRYLSTLGKIIIWRWRILDYQRVNGKHLIVNGSYISLQFSIDQGSLKNLSPICYTFHQKHFICLLTYM